jgi:hypothetical protein
MPALPTILLILAALSVGATIIAAMVAFRSSREAQSAIFPIVKEEEANRARRARISIFIWLAITALLMGGWLASLRFTTPGNASRLANTGQSDTTGTPAVPTVTPSLETPNPSPTVIKIIVDETQAATITVGPEATLPLAPSATTAATNPPTATSTSLPPTATATSVPPTATPTTPPTATPSPTATSTPTSTVTPKPPTPTPTSLADAARIPTVARTPAPAGVKMGPIQFGTEVTDDMELINPGTIFPANVGTIYAVYPFSGIEKGLNFAVVWYQNGVELAREETEWQFGETGDSFSFIVPRGPGLYKLELYINDSVVATKLFEVR